MDRSHLGSYVYGIKFRNMKECDISALKAIEENFLKDRNDVFLITIVDEAAGIISRDDGLSQETDHVDYDQTRDLFMTFHEDSSIKHKYLHDISVDGFENLEENVMELLQGHKHV